MVSQTLLGCNLCASLCARIVMDMYEYCILILVNADVVKLN